MVLDSIMNFLSFDMLSFFDPKSKCCMCSFRSPFSPTKNCSPKYSQRGTTIDTRRMSKATVQAPAELIESDVEIYLSAEDMREEEEEDARTDNEMPNDTKGTRRLQQSKLQIGDGHQQPGTDYSRSDIERENTDTEPKQHTAAETNAVNLGIQKQNGTKKNKMVGKEAESAQEITGTDLNAEHKSKHKTNSADLTGEQNTETTCIDLTDDDVEIMEVSFSEEEITMEVLEVLGASMASSEEVSSEPKLDSEEQEAGHGSTRCFCCNRDKQPMCDQVCTQILTTIVEKCSDVTANILESVEKKAQTIWTLLTLEMANYAGGNYAKWNTLKSCQKLPIYWAALSTDVLSVDPFENFKRFYMNSNRGQRCNRRRENKISQEAISLWPQLTKTQRLPFIIESFLFKVGVGKVKIEDEWEIQNVLVSLLSTKP